MKVIADSDTVISFDVDNKAKPRQDDPEQPGDERNVVECCKALEWFQANFALSDDVSKLVKLRKFQEQAVTLSKDFADQLFILINGKRGARIHLHELIGVIYRLTSDKNDMLYLCDCFKSMCNVDNEYHISDVQFRQVIHSKQGLKSFFKSMDISGNGRLSCQEFLNHLQRLSCMDRNEKWSSWFQYQYGSFMDEDRNIDMYTFAEFLKIEQSTFFAQRFFRILDKANTGRVSTRQLVYRLNFLKYGTATDRLRFLFQLYDMDGNYYIERSELKSLLRSCLRDNKMTCRNKQLEDLTDVLLQDVNTNSVDKITFADFQNQIKKYPNLIDNFKHSNNTNSLVVLLLYLVLNLVLFFEAAYTNYGKPPNIWLIIAKGCGQSLNFNSAFIVTLMLRKCLTQLRSTKLGQLLPLDHHIAFHKLVGWVIVVLSAIHAASHLVNLDLQWSSNLCNISGGILVSLLVIIVVCSLPFIRRRGYFQVFYWTHQLFFAWWICLILHSPSFWIWMLLPATLYVAERIFRLKKMRQAYHGNTYIKQGHVLPSKVIQLEIQRPPYFHFKPGDYISINIPSIARHEWHPFTISSAPEQLGTLSLHIRAVGHWTKRLYNYYKERNQWNNYVRNTSITESISPNTEKATNTPLDIVQDVDLVEMDVLDLEEQGSPLNIPNTIVNDNIKFGGRHSTVVRMEGVLDSDRQIQNSHVVDINTLNCANRQELQGTAEIKSLSKMVESKLEENGEGVEIILDGPYGSPSQHIFESEHAVLIAAGIGVTPFASILQSIHQRYRAVKKCCPSCKHAWKEEIPQTEMKLKKVDFYWINRDHKSFEWFLELLSQLEEEQQDIGPFDDFLQFHLYLTSAIQTKHFSNIYLQMALNLLHKNGGRDTFTGLLSRTETGRPDWDKVFAKIQEDKKGDVTVFYCGPPQLGKTLKGKACQFGMKFRQEQF
ncbi:NADPH oxidase 5-like [Glandiceps talaboti]